MPITKCLLCDSDNLNTILDLGQHPLADTFLKESQLSESDERYPLRVLLCGACGHAMGSYIVPKEKRYQEHEYSYDSANSKVAVEHFAGMAQDLTKVLAVGKEDLVVDIGGNVGTLLAAFHKESGAQILNIEPSENIAKQAEEEGIDTLQMFFDNQAVEEIKRRGGAKVIVATNVFNHIDDIQTFMVHIKDALVPNGAFVFEVPYMLLLVEKLAFDTVYLEHLSYFAIKPLAPFLKRFGLTITDIVESDYMGGSIRVTAQLGDVEESGKVGECIQREERAGIFDKKQFEQWTARVEGFKADLLQQLRDAHANDGVVIGIGAATKGNTLLNYCGIDNSMLKFITDASPLKIGKYTPGSRIPIRDDNAISAEVTHALILPWNIAEFLKGKLSEKHPHLQFIVPHSQ